MLPLPQVVAAVEDQGRRLRAEFYAPQGPRGRRGSCPVDGEIEEGLKKSLQSLFNADFAGEETERAKGSETGYVWMVDPHDGTWDFMNGRRGSAI